MQDYGLQYIGLSRIEGPLIFVENVYDVGYDEVVEIKINDEIRQGRVLEISDKRAVIQVIEGTIGLSNAKTRLRFTGRPQEIPVSRDMLGRVFNGLGQPFDDQPLPFGTERRNVMGMNTLVRGQKLPIFSGNGLPHNRIAAQITRQAKLLSEKVEFTIVFGAMGIKYDVARFFISNFEESGVLGNVVMFLSLANAPSIERLVTPRSALTMAEYLAFECGMHVLVILTDMTNYCESLREISTARGEIPSRKGYPGYLYSDLSSLYERAGRIKGVEGSITQVPILTMPSDDISHPVPDLSGYITEGQIVLERELFQKGIYPPIAGLPSLSRLMKDGIGEGRTRSDHAHLASQLFAAYSKVKDVRALAAVIGEEELSPLDKEYIKFGERFEQEFLRQGEFENRTIEQTLSIGWEVVSQLPKSELHRVTEEEINQYYPGK